MTHPGNDRSVIESEGQVHLHAHGSLDSDDDTYHIDVAITWRHKVEQHRCARWCFEQRFQHQGVTTVPAADSCVILLGRDEPPSMLGRAEQRSEAGR